MSQEVLASIIAIATIIVVVLIVTAYVKDRIKWKRDQKMFANLMDARAKRMVLLLEATRPGGDKK